MSECIIQGSGEGVDLDVINANSADIRNGKISINKEGEPVIGSMPENPSPTTTLNCGQSKVIPAGWNPGGTITANSLASQTGGATATDEYVYINRTYYKDGVKRTGKMTVNSIMSFKAAAYSTNQILFTWQNPYAATGKPFTAVYIEYSTTGYGQNIKGLYSGIGDNSTPGGMSSVICNMPESGKTYYFQISAFVTTSLGNLHGPYLYATAATTAHGRVVLTGSGTWPVPDGVRAINVHGVGAGGPGGCGYSTDTYVGTGGGGGYSKWINGIGVTPRDVLSYEIGACTEFGMYRQSGSTKIFSRDNALLLEAPGGWGGDSAASSRRPNGGSGGGGARKKSQTGVESPAGQGGSNGSDGGESFNIFYGGKGQGSTTMEFGTGTLFSGGGGGSGATQYSIGVGGAGGGGSSGYNGQNGGAGSGGGAGGSYRYGAGAGTGGSGALVITW